MRPAILASAVLALAASAPAAAQQPDWVRPPAKEGYEYPPCYCTNREERVQIGATACLRIGSREVLARCAMSVNNPIWRPLQEGCPPPGPLAAAGTLSPTG